MCVHVNQKVFYEIFGPQLIKEPAFAPGGCEDSASGGSSAHFGGAWCSGSVGECVGGRAMCSHSELVCHSGHCSLHIDRRLFNRRGFPVSFSSEMTDELLLGEKASTLVLAKP